MAAWEQWIFSRRAHTPACAAEISLVLWVLEVVWCQGPPAVPKSGLRTLPCAADQTSKKKNSLVPRPACGAEIGRLSRRCRDNNNLVLWVLEVVWCQGLRCRNLGHLTPMPRARVCHQTGALLTSLQ